MGTFDFITDLFSKKNKGKATGKKAASKSATRAKKATKTRKAKKQTATAGLSLDTSGQRKIPLSVKADPIDEEALGFSITLKDGGESKKRAALRIVIPGLKLHVHRLKKTFPATNISATGVGFKFEKPRVKGGVELLVDIILNDEVQAERVLCKVMRHEKGAVGCLFKELDRVQDDAVHKLVLHGQKLQAQKKKKSVQS